MTNWRCKAGDLLHDGVFPSASYQGFYGFWSWDSWKQAFALTYFNPSLAKSNILAMFDYQDESGMVSDCIYLDKRENNRRDTKPPLAAWAVSAVYRQTKDLNFVKTMYPRLCKYHAWWYANRDHDGNKLCEYGSTDGTKIAAKWESGMDNAVRFDQVQINRNNTKAWSLDLESVDLNAYLYSEKIYLAELAKALGETTDMNLFRQEADTLKNQINMFFYNKEKGFYYDRFTNDGVNKITAEGPEGWIPLWAGIADSVQAKQVKNMLLDSKKFNTYIPLPTLAADNILFNPLKGYWRGPVWLDQFYFAIEGLNNYGYKKEARQLTTKLFEHAEGLLTDKPLRENYHPITGEGLNALNFSWSAAHILMLLKKE